MKNPMDYEKGGHIYRDGIKRKGDMVCVKDGGGEDRC